MKNRFLLTLFLQFCVVALLQAQSGGEGRSFVLSLPYTAPPSVYSPPRVRLLVTSTLGANVSLRYPATGATDAFTVPPLGSYELMVDSGLVMLPQIEGTYRSTIVLESSAPVAAVLMIDRDFSSEAYRAIPDTSLGVEYRAVSFEAPDNGQFFAVIGVHDNTNVTITPTMQSRSGRPAGVPFVVTLNRGDVFQFLSQLYIVGDLSGSLVESDKPVGLLGGAICIDFPIGGLHACNPLLEQILPIDSWGTEFVASPIVADGGSLFRVVARCDSTEIVINNTPAFRLNKDESYAFRFDVGLHIVASGPILCVQYLTAGLSGSFDPRLPNGDPSMIVLQPREQWTRSAMLTTPSLAARTQGAGPVGWRHFLHLSIDTNGLAGLLVDGAPPSFTYSFRTGNWIIGGVALGVGNHTITSASPFGATTYGNSAQDAYGYPLAGVVRAWRLEAEPLSGVVCVDSLDTTIVVRNTGAAPVRVDEIQTTGDIDASILSPGVPFTIAAGGSQSVRVRLRGLSLRKDDGWIVFYGGGCRVRLLVLKVGLARGSLVLDRPVGGAIDFGGVPSTIPYIDTVIVIRNPGRFPMTLLAPTFSIPEMQILSPTFPIIVPPGGYIVVTVRYTPSSTSETTGRVTLRSVECPDSIIISWRGRITSGAYLSVLGPTPLRLLCPPKNDDSIAIKLYNGGDGDYQLQRLDIIGPASADFAIIRPTPPLLGLRRDTVTVVVRYRPGALGVRSASLRLLSDANNADTLLIPLDVRNDTALLAADSITFEFGTFSRCDPPPVGRVRIRNAGTVNLAGLRVSLGDPRLVRGTLESGTDLAVGEGGDVVIEILADSLGNFLDSVVVGANECAEPVVIYLHWRHIASTLLASADSIDFGRLTLCDSVREVDIDITNLGIVADTVELFGLPTAASISLPPGTFPLVIPPNRTATLRVTYRPRVSGTLRDSLKITSRRCRYPITIKLVGRADIGRPQLSLASIDFGSVARGTTKIASLRLTNPTDTTIEFNPLNLMSNRPDLRLIRPLGSFTIPPGGFIDIDLEFSPDNLSPDSLRELLQIPVVSPCSDTLIAEVVGYAPLRGGLLVYWDRDSGRIGEHGIIRFAVRWDSTAHRRDSIELFTELRHDVSILLLDGSISTSAGMRATVVYSNVIGSERSLGIVAVGTLPESGTVITLGVLPALGRADSTLLLVDSIFVRFLADSSVPGSVLSRDGVFRVLGLCEAGGNRRLVVVGTSAAIKQARYETGAIVIDVTLLESAPSVIDLYTLTGERVGTRILNRGAGEQRAMISAEQLASGTYWVVLRTPTSTIQQRVVVP
jgi:hypothetical protein